MSQLQMEDYQQWTHNTAHQVPTSQPGVVNSLWNNLNWKTADRLSSLVPSHHVVCFLPFLVAGSQGSHRVWCDVKKGHGQTNQSLLSSSHPVQWTPQLIINTLDIDNVHTKDISIISKDYGQYMCTTITLYPKCTAASSVLTKCTQQRTCRYDVWQIRIQIYNFGARSSSSQLNIHYNYSLERHNIWSRPMKILEAKTMKLEMYFFRSCTTD